jgi:ABC-type antimicrobial peptide transport system permease subunit
MAAVAGGLGVWLADSLVSNLADIPFLGAALSQFPALRLSPGLALGMFLAAVALGLAAGFVPAWAAYRAKIVDTLRAA